MGNVNRRQRWTECGDNTFKALDRARSHNLVTYYDAYGFVIEETLNRIKPFVGQ